MSFLQGGWWHLLVILVTLVLTIILLRIIRTSWARYIKKSADTLRVDPTTFNFIKNTLSFLIIMGAVIFIFYTIPAFRSLVLTLIASAGIFAAVAGFASQQAFSNIISGIFIVMFKPFRVDDLVKIGQDLIGRVEDITLRHTIIRNFENRRIIIPNSVISSETIINSNIVEEKICVHLEIGISYDSEIDLAMRIMREVSEQHPLCIDNRTPEQKQENNPIVVVRVLNLADYFVLLRAWVWALNADDAFVMKCELLKQVKEEFDRQGVEIPFPYRTLVNKSDLEQKKSELLKSLDENPDSDQEK